MHHHVLMHAVVNEESEPLVPQHATFDDRCVTLLTV